MPSPTGTGSSTATINYTANTGYVFSIVDVNGNTRTYSVVDANHTKVTISDISGTIYRYTVGFDSNISETARTNASVDGSANNNNILATKTFGSTNDPYRPSSTPDALGNVTSATWDVYGNPLTTTSATGIITTYTQLHSIPIRPINKCTRGQQDCNKLHLRLQRQCTYCNHSYTRSYFWQYGYDYLYILYIRRCVDRRYSRQWDGDLEDHYVHLCYDRSFGQPITITDNLSHASHLTYTTRGLTATAIDAVGNETDQTYNLADQPLLTTLPATGQTGIGHGTNLAAYQYVGGLSSSTTVYNESGTAVRQTTGAYGLEGESSSVGGESVEPVGYTYDGLYRTKTLADGNSHSTSYAYNQAGYLSQVTYPDTHTFQYVYDNLGNTTQRTDGRGVVTNYTYNDTTYSTHDALTAISYPASTGINAAFTYDAFGRVTAKTDGAGSYSYIYDDNNTAYCNTTTYTGLTGAKTVSYAFNNDGSRSSMNTPSGSFTYTYDGAGRLTGLTNPASEAIAWTYLDNNWLWKQQMGSTELSAYTYNALGQITDLAHRVYPLNTLLSEFSSMSHDGVGSLTTQTANLPGNTSYSGTINFTYDNKDQITQEQSTRTPPGFPTGYTNTFGYDTAGNATTFKGVTRIYNSSNQNTANTYDNNGNPTTYSGTSMTYDAENGLTAVGSVMTAGYTSGGQLEEV